SLHETPKFPVGVQWDSDKNKYRKFPLTNGRDWREAASPGEPPSEIYGLVMGVEADGVFVIDVDDRGTFDGRLKESGHELPLTFTVRTPTGGLHYYFYGPDLSEGVIGCRVGCFRNWGVHIRGEGGWVVGP